MVVDIRRNRTSFARCAKFPDWQAKLLFWFTINRALQMESSVEHLCLFPANLPELFDIDSPTGDCHFCRCHSRNNITPETIALDTVRSVKNWWDVGLTQPMCADCMQVHTTSYDSASALDEAGFPSFKVLSCFMELGLTLQGTVVKQGQTLDAFLSNDDNQAIHEMRHEYAIFANARDLTKAGPYRVSMTVQNIIHLAKKTFTCVRLQTLSDLDSRNSPSLTFSQWSSLNSLGHVRTHHVFMSHCTWKPDLFGHVQVLKGHFVKLQDVCMASLVWMQPLNDGIAVLRLSGFHRHMSFDH